MKGTGSFPPSGIDGYETQAMRHCDDLLDLILGGTLTPDGMATAFAGRGLISAVLALRDTVAAAAADTADAVTGLDATLGVLAGAVTDTVTGDELPTELHLARWPSTTRQRRT